MAKVLISIILILLVGQIKSQRISEIKCHEYSLLSTNSTKPLPHMAVWIKIVTQTLLIYSREATLISENFLISANFPSNVNNLRPIHSNRVYFATDDWRDVEREIKHPLYRKDDGFAREHYNIALLKIEKIVVDSFHRPACVWTRGHFKPNTVHVFSSNFNKMLNEDSTLWNTEPHNENFLAMSLISFNISDQNVACNQNNTFCLESDMQDENSLLGLKTSVQLQKPFSYLPNNFYVFGMTTGRVQNNSMNALSLSESIDWIETQVWPVSKSNPSCGRVEKQLNPMIMFAQPTFYGEFPWHTALYDISKFGDRKYVCGGTLLNEITIITAAHCVVSENGAKSPSQFLVVAGKHDLILNTPESHESRVSHVIVHNEYDLNNLNNDIAIIRLDTEMPYSRYIQPICITSDAIFFENRIGVLPGWGINELSELETVLVKAKFPKVGHRECQRTKEHKDFYLNQNNFCAGYQNGTNVCSGDGGGGLVVENGNQWFLMGVSSLGFVAENGMCDPFELPIFTDVPKFYNWIMQHM